MVKIAVTGGIACGKSLVGEFLSDEGIPVCDADALAHDLMAPGTAVYKAIAGRFGKRFLRTDGTIDRALLGKYVFARPAFLRDLNALIHPAVKLLWKKWLSKQDAEAAAVIIPLLYEVGEGKKWDAVICVSASRTTQLRRLRERGLSLADATRRIGAQMKTSQKAVLSDYVLWNDGNEAMLKDQVTRVVRSILEK